MEEVVVLGELCRACLLKTTNMKNLSTTDANSLDLLKKLSCICNLKEVRIAWYFQLLCLPLFSFFRLRSVIVCRTFYVSRVKKS